MAQYECRCFPYQIITSEIHKYYVFSVRLHYVTGYERPEEKYRYSSTLSSTSALDGVDGQREAPAALLLGIDSVPIVGEVG